MTYFFLERSFSATPREKVLTLSIIKYEWCVVIMVVLSATWFITNLLNHFMIVN